MLGNLWCDLDNRNLMNIMVRYIARGGVVGFGLFFESLFTLLIRYTREEPELEESESKLAEFETNVP